MTQSKIQKDQSHSGGFTTIEMAILVIIAGLFVASSLPIYLSYKNNRDYKATIEAMDSVQEALKEYFSLHGRYPCPADPVLKPTDANYGKEQCRQPPLFACPPGIVCTDVGARDADNDSAHNPDSIYIGALPTADLNDKALYAKIERNDMYDAYGDQFTYAVTEKMTDQNATVSDPVNLQLGAIALKDENNKDTTSPPESAHYVIISHGENRRGAYTRDGKTTGDCSVLDLSGNPAPAGSDIGVGGVEVEKENCDRNDAIFVKGLRSLRDGDSYYDDIVYFNASGSNALWAKSNHSPKGQVYLYNTNFGNVGVGVDDALSKLQVNGPLRVGTETQADNGYCGISGADCVDPYSLSSTGAMKTTGGLTSCPAGEAAYGIEQNKLLCKPVFTATPPANSCSGGLHVTGISSLGNLHCN